MLLMPSSDIEKGDARLVMTPPRVSTNNGEVNVDPPVISYVYITWHDPGVSAMMNLVKLLKMAAMSHVDGDSLFALRLGPSSAAEHSRYVRRHCPRVCCHVLSCQLIFVDLLAVDSTQSSMSRTFRHRRNQP